MMGVGCNVGCSQKYTYDWGSMVEREAQRPLSQLGADLAALVH